MLLQKQTGEIVLVHFIAADFGFNFGFCQYLLIS